MTDLWLHDRSLSGCMIGCTTTKNRFLNIGQALKIPPLVHQVKDECYVLITNETQTVQLMETKKQNGNF